MKRLKLTEQIILFLSIQIFAVITLFSVFLNVKLISVYERLNYSRLETFASNTKVVWNTGNYLQLKDFNTDSDIGYFTIENINPIAEEFEEYDFNIVDRTNNPFIDVEDEQKIIDLVLEEANQLYEKQLLENEKEEDENDDEISPETKEELKDFSTYLCNTTIEGLIRDGKEEFYYAYVGGVNRSVIIYSSSNYIISESRATTASINIAYIIVVLFGLIFSIFWSRKLVKKIGLIKDHVNDFPKNDYSKSLELKGNDELNDLLNSIEIMREEIKENEKIKREMLQNVSHDFKTPLAVIKSYAEAIGDGIEDINSTEIIIKQTENLQKKVAKLLQLNRLEYIDNDKEFENVKIKDIIDEVVGNLKLKMESNIQINLDLDETCFNGFTENYYTVVENILDNALRYAKSQINITLNNGILEFYNDGDHISNKFIDNQFKPYEKGEKGQFGVGMSIVQKTINHFGLDLKVENKDIGVSFYIIDKNYKN